MVMAPFFKSAMALFGKPMAPSNIGFSGFLPAIHSKSLALEKLLIELIVC
jgi:hypothetical protein